MRERERERQGPIADLLPLPVLSQRLLSEGSFLFLPSECPEGLEILITLRHANASCPSGGEEVAGPFGSCDPSACRPRDLVEFRIGSQCVTIAEAGLAEDFFRQFACRWCSACRSSSTPSAYKQLNFLQHGHIDNESVL